MRTVAVLVLAGLTLVAVGCHHSPPSTAVPPDRQPSGDADAARRAREEALARARQDSIADALAARRRADSLAALQQSGEGLRGILAAMIHFDYNQSDIRTTDAQILERKAPILRANPMLRIKIIGNADERGSDEYNLVLGNQRAFAAKQYLVRLGIDSTRIETASNGEERPIAPGHDEASWEQNRNDQFTVVNGEVKLKAP
jgi:peptidoglycan-associated lipoprotein